MQKTVKKLKELGLYDGLVDVAKKTGNENAIGVMLSHYIDHHEDLEQVYFEEVNKIAQDKIMDIIKETIKIESLGVQAEEFMKRRSEEPPKPHTCVVKVGVGVTKEQFIELIRKTVREELLNIGK